MAYNYVPRLSDTGLLTLPYYNRSPNPFEPLISRYNKTKNYAKGPHGECTTYAYGRWLEIAQGDVTKLRGLLETRGRTNGHWNGGAWYQASNPSIRAGKTNPQPGDIMCLRKGTSTDWFGHVGVVEEVHTDYVLISQSEHSGKLFNTTKNYANLGYTGERQGNYYQRNGYELQGFLRMEGVPSYPVVPDFNMPTEWVHYPRYYSMTESDRKNNAVMAAVQLYSYGWTLEAIAGAIGNFVRESNLDPEARGTGGGGLVGWTPLANLTRWTSYYGYTWYDGEKQIEFIDMGVYCSGYDSETGSPILEAQWLPGRVGGLRYEEYKRMTQTPERMAQLFMEGYEAPGIPALAERQANARKYYDFLLGVNLTDPIRPYIEKMPFYMLAGNAKPRPIY